MNHLGINLTVTCNKTDILAKLLENREQHSKLVKEARDGYVTRAQEELTKRLTQLKEGKIVALAFNLRVPQDYTSVYDTVIGMLKAHTGDSVTLSASEYNHFVEDNWDWVRDFSTSNSAYSAGTRNWGRSKGFDIE